MNLNKLMMLLLVVGMASCSTDYDTAEYFDLEELPGYVAFDASGNEANVADVAAAETDGSVTVEVENPTGSETDITANYSIGGSAEWGVDYTIDGATNAGGSVTIKEDRNVGQTNRGSINITLLTDDVVDGEKMITLTLTSASNAAGSIAVGRGGTDFQKSVNVIIADVDM